MKKKSHLMAIFLAIFLGPLGLVYANKITGLILLALFVTTANLGWSMAVIWALSIALSVILTSQNNVNVDNHFRQLRH